MELDTFRELLTPAGQAALALAASFAPTTTTFPACVDRLRKAYSANLAKAAVETVLLRGKAASKFPDAARMYFTREALEQASGHVIAHHRVLRFPGSDSVADLCCGIGGDTLALAAGRHVIAVDLDPLHAEMARANAAALGLADRVTVQVGDACDIPLGNPQAAFADPGRRQGEKRYLSLQDYLPPPSRLRDRFPDGFPLGFKLAPGVNRDEVDRWGGEMEFLSVDGELKECVLWCGPLRTTRRRATVLRQGQPPATYAAEELTDPRPPREPGEYVFDPEAALVRAELEHDLAERLALHPLDDGIALFTGDDCPATPFGDWYRIEHSAAFHLGRLRDYLREQRVGRVTMLKRASTLDANEVMKKLKLEGSEHRHVILTRSLGQPWVLVVHAVARQDHG